MKSLHHINHTLNTSPSKMGYTFTKQSRFLPKLETSAHDLSYNADPLQTSTHVSDRSTSFGYGKKMDLARKQSGPSPLRYHIPGEFDSFNKTNSLRRGKSFGVSRQKYLFLDPLQGSKRKLPGPGEYKLNTSTLRRTSGYMASKAGVGVFDEKAKVPGPGAYKVENTFLSQSGSFMLSKYKNPESPNFRFKTENPSPIRNTRYEQSRKVGPGSYNDFEPMNPEGSYFTAKYRSHRGKIFDRQKRAGLIDEKQQSKTPGPGLYQHFSIFGDS